MLAIIVSGGVFPLRCQPDDQQHGGIIAVKGGDQLGLKLMYLRNKNPPARKFNVPQLPLLLKCGPAESGAFIKPLRLVFNRQNDNAHIDDKGESIGNNDRIIFAQESIIHPTGQTGEQNAQHYQRYALRFFLLDYFNQLRKKGYAGAYSGCNSNYLFCLHAGRGTKFMPLSLPVFPEDF